MGGASLPQDPMMGGDQMANDPMLGGTPIPGADMSGMDQSGMGGDMGEGPMGGDPNAMGGDPSAMGGEDPNAGEDSDGTMSIISQLSPTDKEAVRSYAQSMLNRDETQMDGSDQMQGGQSPMMEQVIFTKKQINKIQENLGPTQDELMDKDDRKSLPKKQNRGGNSPFSSPRFS